MRNMKIPVENNLDEIVGELERLGLRSLGFTFGCDAKWIVVINSSSYTDARTTTDKFKLTTLAELKEQLNAAD